MDSRGYNLTSKPQHISDDKISKLVEDVNRLSEQLSPNQKIVLVRYDWRAAQLGILLKNTQIKGTS